MLADALALADEDKPALIVDFATLTGAARVALGPDMPPFFTDDDALAAELCDAAAAENDPLWRLPLWRPYDNDAGFEGGRPQQCRHRRPWRRHHRRAVPAPLRRRAPSWLHLDIFAWTPAAKPGRPEGGECQSARALYALLSRALRLSHGRARSPPASVPPRNRGELSARPGRGRAFRRGQAISKWSSPAPTCGARRRTRRALDTEVLLGERVTVYETTDEGWAWGQLESDGYVGWLSANALGRAGPGADP